MLDDYSDRIREIELRVALRGTSERATAEFLKRAEEDIREMIDLCANVEADARKTVENADEEAKDAVSDVTRERDEARGDLAVAARLLAALRAHPALRAALDADGIENLPDLAFAVWGLSLFDLIRQADDAARSRERDERRAAEYRERDAARVAQRFDRAHLARRCAELGLLALPTDRKIDLARRIVGARG